jgi:polysaccharide export outer membrane protein
MFHMMTLSKLPRVWSAFCGLVLAGVLLGGCAGSATMGDQAGAAGGAALTGQPDNNASEMLSVGDTLSIIYNDLPILQQPFEGQIKRDGTITLILNQSFQAAGKTRSQLEAEIRERYVPTYFKNMTVTIIPKVDTRYYYVAGEVRSPGARMYLNRITVLKAIQTSGDFTDFANRKKVRLTRASGGNPIMLNASKILKDPSRDVEVYPGDTIYVHRKIW